MNSDNPITFFREWADACFSEANICDTIVFYSTNENTRWGEKNIVGIYYLVYWMSKEVQEDFFKKWVEDEVVSAISIFNWKSDSRWKFEFKIEKWTEYDVHIFNHESINPRFKDYSDDYFKYDINDPRRYTKEYLNSHPKREDYDEKGYLKDKYIHPGNEKFLK